MTEDKARLERRIGVSLKEKNAKPGGIGRRAFLRAAVLGAGSVAGYGLI